MDTNIGMGLAVNGFGLIFWVIGFLVYAVEHFRQKHMTAVVTGRISRYSYYGNGNIAPVVAYTVNGKNYEVRRKFRSVVEKTVRTFPPSCGQNSAYVTDKDVLVLQTGSITDYDAVMSKLWPVGRQVPVFYDPEKPKRACAEKKQHLPGVITVVYFWVGLGIMALGFLLWLLLPTMA